MRNQLSRGLGKKALDNEKSLRDDLERQLNELADIIVEFYNEWKQQ